MNEAFRPEQPITAHSGYDDWYTYATALERYADALEAEAKEHHDFIGVLGDMIAEAAACSPGPRT